MHTKRLSSASQPGTGTQPKHAQPQAAIQIKCSNAICNPLSATSTQVQTHIFPKGDHHAKPQHITPFIFMTS